MPLKTHSFIKTSDRLTGRAVILFFQLLKPFWHGVMRSAFGITFTCIHNPSCSHYAAEQIRHRGTILGLYWGAKRVLACSSGSLL